MDVHFLNLALQEARKRQGRTAPNPAVGAVLVRNGVMIKSGFHWGPGHPHAEVMALNSVEAKGGTLYVTLEPCCHFGRTPPCTDLIISKEIKRVVFGFKDPNPVVCGKGEQKLKAKGIRVDFLPLPEIQSFYESYLFWTKESRPFLSFKIATSLDFIYSSGLKKKRLLLNKEKPTLEYTHQGRLASDFILTTGKTVRYDNPRLNVRLTKETIKKKVVVLEKTGVLPENSNLLNTAEKIFLFFDERLKSKYLKPHKKIERIPMRLQRNGFDLEKIIFHEALKGFHEGWIEAGGEILSSFCKGDLLNKLSIIQSSTLEQKGVSLNLPLLKKLLVKAEMEKVSLFNRELVREYWFKG